MSGKNLEKSTKSINDENEDSIDEETVDVQPLLEMNKTFSLSRSVKSELLGIKKTLIVDFLNRKK